MRPRPWVVAAALAPLLVGCAGDDSLMKKAAVATGFATKPPEPAGFVRENRAQGTDYMPIGVAAAPRPSDRKAAAEVKATEESLAETRDANEAAGAEVKAAGETPAPTTGRAR